MKGYVKAQVTQIMLALGVVPAVEFLMTEHSYSRQRAVKAVRKLLVEYGEKVKSVK